MLVGGVGKRRLKDRCKTFDFANIYSVGWLDKFVVPRGPMVGLRLFGGAGGLVILRTTICRLSMFLFLAACTQQPPPPAVLAPEPLATTSRITILPLKFENPTVMPKPVAGSGAGAAAGASQGASIAGGVATTPAQGGKGSYMEEQALTAAAGLVLLPITALVGAVIGALSAHPEKEVLAAGKAITAAYIGEPPSERIRDKLIRHAHIHSICGLTGADTVNGEPTVTELAALGTETVLIIDVTHFGITMVGSIDPDIVPYIGVETRYLDSVSGRLVSRSRFYHFGKALNYFEAAASEAEILKTEINQGYQEITNKIERELFGSGSSKLLDTLPIERC